ncbi:MAG: hypothetical protein WB646_16630 [Steroidobacteraceae bacterium]
MNPARHASASRGLVRATLALLSIAAAVPAQAADRVAPDSASAAIRPQADLPASVLEHYVGYYEVGGGLVLTISRQGEQLYAQLTGQQAAAIYPETVASFYYKVIDARVDFIPDPPTQINALVLHQGGNDLVAPRIDAIQAQRLQAAVSGRAQGQAAAPASAQAAAQLLAGLAAGAPDYGSMTPELASAMRQQLPQLQELLARLGPVQSIRFVGVANQGWDLYLVTHERGTSELRIRLNSSGAVAGALLSSGP